jgi:hypothetical protein
VPFGASERLGYDARPLLVLRALIHWSAWNRNSANFAFWGFSEVALFSQLSLQYKHRRSGGERGEV